MIAKLASVNADVLVGEIFAALQDNGYGQYDRLIAAMVPALGKDGLEQLKALFEQSAREPSEKPGEHDRQVIGWSSNGPVYEDEIYDNHRELTVRIALQEIADALGDVDAYIAQQPENTRKAPMVAADIASRLLAAGRADEALLALDRVDTRGRSDVPIEWQLARVNVLEALGRGDEAQAYRWTCFEQSLNDQHLSDFLHRLPDFDDMEAEQRAYSYAQAFPDANRALAFFLRWPSLEEAAKLVTVRLTELDGDLYELMTGAAEALQEKHPLAATIVLRSMIDFTLDSARSSRYKHAARHLAECGALAPHIDDHGNAESHDAYMVRLKYQHGKKQGFWKHLD